MASTLHLHPDRYRFVFGWFLIGLAFVLLFVAIYFFLPGGNDWNGTYRPATLAALSLDSPYTVEIFHSPPWTILPLIPFAILPIRLGYALLFLIGIVSTGFVAYRLGAKPWTIAALLLSYPILFMGTYGQIEWLIFLGFILPPRWGLFFLLIKPQTSIGIIVFWAIEAYREGGIRKATATFFPITIALLVSVIMFGPWFQSGFREVGQEFSASLWPQSIPIGLVLLSIAVRKRQSHLAMISSPFLSPYLAPHGWGVALLGLSAMPLELLLAVVGLWTVRVMTGQFLH